MLSKYFSIVLNYVLSVFFAKKVHFLPLKHASRCFSNGFSQHYWQESFDDDSFGSQSRFDAHVLSMSLKCVHTKQQLLLTLPIQVSNCENEIHFRFHRMTNASLKEQHVKRSLYIFAVNGYYMVLGHDA